MTSNVIKHCQSCGDPVHVPEEETGKETIECMECGGLENGFLFDPATTVKEQNRARRAWENAKLISYMTLLGLPTIALIGLAKAGDLLPKRVGKYFDLPLVFWMTYLIGGVVKSFEFNTNKDAKR